MIQAPGEDSQISSYAWCLLPYVSLQCLADILLLTTIQGNVESGDRTSLVIREEKSFLKMPIQQCIVSFSSESNLDFNTSKKSQRCKKKFSSSQQCSRVAA